MFYQIASKHFQLIDHLPLLLSTQSNPLWYDLSHLPRNPKLGGVVHPQTSSCQQTFCDWSQSWASLSWLIRVELAFYDWSELSKPFMNDQSQASPSLIISMISLIRVDVSKSFMIDQSWCGVDGGHQPVGEPLSWLHWEKARMSSSWRRRRIFGIFAFDCWQLRTDSGSWELAADSSWKGEEITSRN